MKRQEYENYEKAVKDFFDREGINNLTTACSEETPVCSGCNEQQDLDPFFSWRACECCGRNLGGNRYHANGYNPTTKEIYCFDVCTDCLYYAEYGQLDDMTMLEIEDSEAAEAERRYELRAAFGEGETVVNILTGEKTKT